MWHKRYRCTWCDEEFDEPRQKWWEDRVGDGWLMRDCDEVCPFCGHDRFDVVKDEEDENEEDDQADQDCQPRGVA